MSKLEKTMFVLLFVFFILDLSIGYDIFKSIDIFSLDKDSITIVNYHDLE